MELHPPTSARAAGRRGPDRAARRAGPAPSSAVLGALPTLGALTVLLAASGWTGPPAVPEPARPPTGAPVRVGPVTHPPPCPLLLLRMEDGKPSLDVDRLPAGSIESFPLGEASGIIGVLQPSVDGAVRRSYTVRPGSGASATVHCARDTMFVAYRDGEGRRGRTPDLSVSDLRRSWIRIDVAGGQLRKRYLLREGELVAPDPLAGADAAEADAAIGQAGRVVVTSAGRLRPPGTASGGLTIHRVGPYLTGSVAVPGGGTGEAILDLGANRTTLSTGILAMAAGARMTPAALRLPRAPRDGPARGLGGELSRVGAVHIAGIRVGDVDFPDVSVNVLDELPALERHIFAAVVGTDLLSRADVVRIRMPTTGTDGKLELLTGKDAVRSASPVWAEVPFIEVAGLIVIPGTIGDRTVPMVLDTGSPTTLLTPELASDLGLFPVGGDPTTLSGLDGTPIQAWPDTVATLEIGGTRFDSLPAAVAVLPVLRRIGLPRRSILLGEPFLGRFQDLDIDWRLGVVRFYR